MRFIKISGKSPLERFLRSLALVSIILLVGWAFWKNNQTMMERIHVDNPFWDETGTLSSDARKYAKDFARTMAETHGLEVRIRIRRELMDRPEPVSNRLFLGLVPSQQQVIFVLPAEDTSEKGKELAVYLESKHFERHWDEDWGEGLKSALVLIWNQKRDHGLSIEEASGDGAPVVDETGILLDEDRAFIRRFAEALDSEFGQSCQVRLHLGPVQVPELDNRTLFIGISTGAKESLVSFPPMMRRALGPDLERTLMSEHFPSYLESEETALGLKTALITIWKALADEELE